MTERLYYTDARLTRFSAKVVAADGPRVTLDRSAFYPTSGGQLHDTGSLGGRRVVDVIDDGDVVAHMLDEAVGASVGDTIEGVVDWPRRFDHMQQHTGQHLLSAVFDDLYGAKTVSVHFGAESATLDLDAAPFSNERIVKAELRANAVIAENRPVTVTFEDAATATGLRKPSDRDGTIRVVTIADADRSACGGTHVAATGEIGALTIRRVEKYKQGCRVEFRCGARALARARADYQMLADIASGLTAGIDELPTLIASKTAELDAVLTSRKKLAETVAGFRARELCDAATPDVTGVRRVVAVADDADGLRALAQACAALPKVLFAGTCASPPTIVIAASDDSGANAGALLKPALAAVGGRGGGSPRLAQGTAPSADALAGVASAVVGAS
ncbi:MAG: alanyl-tRNA editing protein [Gemmatimonadetes bacterium]|nr:alanyl-tRNA editing protein [Gemmatimonadota bacterium]